MPELRLIKNIILIHGTFIRHWVSLSGICTNHGLGRRDSLGLLVRFFGVYGLMTIVYVDIFNWKGALPIYIKERCVPMLPTYFDLWSSQCDIVLVMWLNCRVISHYLPRATVLYRDSAIILSNYRQNILQRTGLYHSGVESETR